MQNIPLNDDDHAKLKVEYEAIVLTWPKLGLGVMPPTLEQWIGARAIVGGDRISSDSDLGDIRLFNAVEKLITNLRLYSFNLTHIDTEGKKFTDSSLALSEMLVQNFKLPQHYTKRLRELFDYYQKSLAETASIEHVGFTALANESLIDAFHRLMSRTTEAINEHEVEVERAIGRIEGAAALMVRTNVMTREKAAAETDEFKKAARKKK